ncbi:unnamed protein product [Polarella glacialis]|uniref:Uncharacterized protein n=1 Tax=Polarella glacialis TaxID=89957 RepID=A0A813LFP0_POLGL|nr:unnamed protein product [Polarella glacialis]
MGHPIMITLLQMLLLSCSVFAQPGIPSIPTFPPTYQMNRSTIIMPCNSSGLTDPASTKGWGIVDFDWSNGKDIWAKAKPMNCEEMLVEQVKKTTSASPGTTVWVYRNGIKALPWYTLVRTKVTDPAYSKWFMPFSPAVIANHSAAHVPVCDNNYDPPQCSNLYHDQMQTPGYPKGDGICDPPGCDVGSVPVGEYLFDPRAGNVSVNGQTLIEWYIEEYLFGPTGAGNPNISGFYFDDTWTTGGPSEMDGHAAEDMGLTAADLADLIAAFQWQQSHVYATILKRGKFTWNQFWNGSPEKTAWIDCPAPMVAKKTCSADVRSLCNASSPARTVAMVYSFSPGCMSSTEKLADPDTDIAAFLLTRGPYAWLGHGWSNCNRVYEYPTGLDFDYGEPLSLCKETKEGSGIFTREWSKSTVHMDCNTFKGTVTMKKQAPYVLEILE